MGNSVSMSMKCLVSPTSNGLKGYGAPVRITSAKILYFSVSFLGASCGYVSPRFILLISVV